MLRPAVITSVFALSLLLVCPVGANAAAPDLDAPGEHLVAVFDGHEIPPVDVANHHCHDLDLPVIRCFATAAERDGSALDSLASQAIGDAIGLHLLAPIPLGLQSVTFVLYYEDSDYLGDSFMASGPVPNLGTIGWNNMISSFKSTNGGRPKWWDNTNYTGTAWQWAVSVWVPYVGDSANDRFTSLQNVP